MLGYKSIDSLMDVNTKLLPDQGSFLRMLGGTGDWRKTELPEGDQIGHHIHSQCGVSHFFVSTENYSLGGGNKDFDVSEKSFMENFSIQIMDTLE